MSTPETQRLGRGPTAGYLSEVAEGVWLLRGDLKQGMNVCFIREGDGVVQFDAGTQPMTRHVREAARRLGGLRRIVLGHADSDHRGSAPHLGAPVFCHPGDAAAAEAPGPYRDYWDMSKITRRATRLAYPLLHRRWDGGAARVAGTVEEGDDVAGFEVVHLPGHAPGLIGLWRESDRLVLCSDTIYLGDAETFEPLPKNACTVPHVAFNMDTAMAVESARKLASLRPRTLVAGHDEPRSGDHLAEMIEAAADAV